MGSTVSVEPPFFEPNKELQKLGGAKVVLAKVTNADAMAAVMGGRG
jgi:hypothetical protein